MQLQLLVLFIPSLFMLPLTPKPDDLYFIKTKSRDPADPLDVAAIHVT